MKKKKLLLTFAKGTIFIWAEFVSTIYIFLHAGKCSFLLSDMLRALHAMFMFLLMQFNIFFQIQWRVEFTKRRKLNLGNA